MKIATLKQYPKRIVALLAAFEALAVAGKVEPTKVGATYAALAEKLGLDLSSPAVFQQLRLHVLDAKRAGLLRTARAGGGRGQKAVIALTDAGVAAL